MYRLANSKSALTAVLLSLTLLMPHETSLAQEESVEEELHVHRLNSEATSPYDAWAYSNRIAAKPEKGQPPVEFAGNIIFSRLANVEGRVQLKIVDGFERSAYLGYKSFLRGWPEEGKGVGNCVQCHTPSKFTDGKKYVVGESGTAKLTPTLRNLKKTDKELEAIVRHKVEMAQKARAGTGNIDEAYKLIQLDDSQVKDMVNFLKGLNEVPKEKFRQLTTDAEILDTSDLLD